MGFNFLIASDTLIQCGFHLASLPHHELAAIGWPLSEMGYRSVAIRASSVWLSSEDGVVSGLVNQLAKLRQVGLEIVLDGDGLFVTDPWDAAAPRLARASENADREAMLIRLIDLAARIDGRLMTFSVGQGEVDDEVELVLKRIAESIARIAGRAISNGVTIGIKPTLGAAIETASQFRRLLEWLPSKIATSLQLGWAADIAVMARRGELPIGDRLARDADRLVCIYLSDIAAGTVGDMRFGKGDLAIGRIVAAIAGLRFPGPVIARCEGHGEVGLLIAKEAIEIIGKHCDQKL